MLAQTTYMWFDNDDDTDCNDTTYYYESFIVWLLQADYFTSKATVVYMKKDNCLYKVRNLWNLYKWLISL